MYCDLHVTQFLYADKEEQDKLLPLLACKFTALNTIAYLYHHHHIKFLAYSRCNFHDFPFLFYRVTRNFCYEVYVVEQLGPSVSLEVLHILVFK
jgi:hypothetical protein